MFRDCRVALGVVGDRPQKAAHGPDVLALGRFVRDGVPASGRLGHAEAVLLDLRLLQPVIAEGSFRVLKRLVVLGEIGPSGHLDRAPLPTVPLQPDQSHVVVARFVFSRLRHQRFEVFPRPDALDRVPGRFSSFRAPQKPGRQRRFTAFSEAPTNAAYAPRRAFSAAYQAMGRPRIFRRHSRRIAPRCLKKSGPCERPRTKLSTSSAAHSAEKLLSVAPSATATRQRVGESEPRTAHASSYSDRAFPAFWQENASIENGAALTGCRASITGGSRDGFRCRGTGSPASAAR